MTLATDSGIVVTCEHGGAEVPSGYRGLFSSAGAQAALRSHRGYDPGALVAAQQMAAHFSAPLVCSTVTRLLVDLNRSRHSNDVLSKYSRVLDSASQASLFRSHYDLYRRQVVDCLTQAISEQGAVTHVSVHTFTPRFRGTRRDVHLGVLFDPQRSRESDISRRWCRRLRSRLPSLVVGENKPYLGTDDGLTTWLRTQHDDSVYAGIELEINNRFAKRSTAHQQRLVGVIANALAES